MKRAKTVGKKASSSQRNEAVGDHVKRGRKAPVERIPVCLSLLRGSQRASTRTESDRGKSDSHRWGGIQSLSLDRNVSGEASEACLVATAPL